MGKIIKNGKIYGSTNSKDIKYNPSKNVLSLKTNNVKDTIDKISEIIKNLKILFMNVKIMNIQMNIMIS